MGTLGVVKSFRYNEMLTICSHKNLLGTTPNFLVWCFFLAKTHHHGENLHHMEQVPEGPARGISKSPDAKALRGNRSPAEIKRLTHQKTKQQAKKNTNT